MMRFMVDHSKPLDSPDRCRTDNSYDGRPDSDVLSMFGHWHKYHDETWEVLQGRMSFTVEGKTAMVSAGEPQLRMPRWHVHSFTAFKDEAVTFKEKTDPTGDFKKLFFRDLFRAGSPTMLLAIRAFYEGDTYIALPGNIKIVDQVFMTITGSIAKLLVPAKPAVFHRHRPDNDVVDSKDSTVAPRPSAIRKKI